jgi:excisionase family DNA binding protein
VSVSISITLADEQLEAITVRVAEILAAQAPASPAPPAALTVAEAAKRMRVSEKTIRRAISDGRLPAHRIGRAVRIDAAEVAKLTMNPAVVQNITRRSARPLGAHG